MKPLKKRNRIIKERSETSIKKYKSLLKLYLLNEKIGDYNKTFINLFDKKTERGQFISKETIRSCISAILWFIETRKPNETKLINEYRLLMAHLRKSCLFDTRTNTNIKQEVLDWDYILQIRETLKNKVEAIKKKHPVIIVDNVVGKCELNIQEKAAMKKYLIACLYTYNPPRRLLDYGRMNIINNLKDFELLNKQGKTKEHNYYLYDNKIFVFCYYKTVNIYGIQYLSINNELDKALKDYINLMGLSKGKLLFANKDFEQLVRKTFKVGVNTIRHSFISNLYESTHGHIDPKVIDKVSLQMAHSVKTNIGYYKIAPRDTETVTVNISYDKKELLKYRKVAKKRIINMILFIIAFIVVKICVIRFKRITKGKTYQKYHKYDKCITETTENNIGINDIMQKKK